MLLKLLYAGDLVVDIGANIGWHTVVAALAVGENGRVIAFEPNAENAALLRQNVLANDLAQVEVRQSAVSDRDGEGALYLSRSNLGDHRLDAPDPTRRSERVDVQSLATLVADEGRPPALIKIDAQGSEIRILGSVEPEALANTALLIEFWPRGLESAGGSGADLAGILGAIGHDLYIVDHWSPEIIRTSPAELMARSAADLAPSTDASIDLLCLPAGRALPSLL